jgi:hypothetical protein
MNRLELLGERERNPVQRGDLVEGARLGAFQARPVVPEGVDDDRGLAGSAEAAARLRLDAAGPRDPESRETARNFAADSRSGSTNRGDAD